MARKTTHLVCQHIEGLSRKALEEHPRLIKAYVRKRHGIYALYRKNRLYYVGLASNLRSRLNTHLRDRHAKTWNRFSVYLTIGDVHLRELESLVIRIASPRGNKIRGSLGRSENLKRRFKRDVANQYRAEIEELFGGYDDAEEETKTSKDGVRRAPLAPFVTRSFKIRWRFKGRLYRARVRRDGLIRLRGKIYRSPSGAAKGIARRSVDGWHSWEFERAPGDWVFLNELRR